MQHEAHRIVIADSDALFSEELSDHLRLEGHQVAVAETAEEALSILKRGPISLLALDVRLAGESGTELLRRVRSDWSRLPVIVTGYDDAVDKVVAFELGADDFIVKPPSFREFALRIRAILRRSRSAAPPAPERITIGPMIIDTARHEVLVEGVHVPLTALEFRVLCYLAAQSGRVRTREQMLEDVWGGRSDTLDRAVDTNIKRLRRKLGPAGDWIQTVRGVGYRLRTEPRRR